MKLRGVAITALLLAVEISVGALEDDLAVVLDKYITRKVVACNVRADEDVELVSRLRVGRARQYQPGREDAEKHGQRMIAGVRKLAPSCSPNLPDTGDLIRQSGGKIK